MLFTGLHQSIIDISSQHINGEPKECIEARYQNINYYHFSKYFVDNVYNLKDIMMQISMLNDNNEQKIKEVFYLLLSLFILTYEYRSYKVQMIIW